MTTIIDVAKYAGVSKSTVSRVLTNNGYVSPESKEKVLAAIAQLDYIPNYLARNFRNNKTQTIGFIISKSIRLFGTFIEEFITIAESYHYEIVIYCSQGSAEKEIEYLNLLKYKQVDAIFILTRVNEWELIEKYSEYGPIATWHRVDSDFIFSPYVDHYPIYMDIIECLGTAGYPYIGNILSSPNNQNTVASLMAINHPDNQKYSFWNFFCAEQEGAAQEALLSFLALSKKPEALIIYSDYVAGEFIQSLSKENRELLTKTKIISFDNSMISQLMDITSIDLDISSQAYNSFMYLYNELNQRSFAFKKTSVRIVPRKTFFAIDQDTLKHIDV